MNDPLTVALIRYTDAGAALEGGVVATAAAGLHVVRGDRTKSLRQTFYESALIAVVSGAKDVLLGGERYSYGAGQYFVLGVGLPVVGSITQATADAPYLAVALALDLTVIGELLAEIEPAQADADEASGIGLFVGALQARQRDALARLGALLDDPVALRVLYPAIAREIFYWALVGPEGPALRRLVATDGSTRRIADAIRAIRADLTSNVPMERLAEMADMSLSSFYAHFKTVTSMSPLQYQKQLRLLEARRLMLAGGADVARAAYHVGYESTSQFSREYARMFGAPPRRDVEEQRAAVSA